jgi:hypothetical protein
MSQLVERITTYDYDELWDNFSDTVCELVPLSQRDISILLSSMRGAHWSARWYAGEYKLRDIGRLSDYQDAVDYVENLERKLLMTGCLEGLITALENISDVIKKSSCCFESGAGGQFIDDDFYYGEETPLDEPTSFGVGEEFATEAEYEAHKCEAANFIVNGLIGSLNGMSILTLSSLIAGSVAAAVVGVAILTVPPVAVLVALAATGMLFGALSTIAGAIEDNRTDLVCLLYASTTAVEAYDNLRAALEDLSVDLGFVEVEVGAISNLIMNLCPIDTLNNLFRSVGLPEIPGDTVDCDAACGGCPAYRVVYGSYNPDTGIAQSMLDPWGHHRFMILFNNTVEGYCGDMETVSISEITGTPDCPPSCGYRLRNQSETLVYSSESTPPASPVTCGKVELLDSASDSPFSVLLTY